MYPTMYCGEQSEVAPVAGAKTFRSDHLAQLLLFPSLSTALTTWHLSPIHSLISCFYFEF
ncbi:hypothetical protein N7471_005920 [Penicillium samsonianum]|uniref:uncharacterized protein n=1 Tax=Penicillium samsonianum TaxID=1882272 RepID=UPI0025479F2D|nr:uncharacterized protein N7471_005920 [Penicillium samsonianum]KAJ6139434.1 hypothetical protein N7471_005920 [Penicillium samsonianum]